MTGNYAVRSRRSRSLRASPRSGSVSTPSPRPPRPRYWVAIRPVSSPPAPLNRVNSNRRTVMQPQFSFFLSIAFSSIAWVIVSTRYIWPELRLRQRAEALRPLLILHSFRFMGLAFLVPGVVSPDLPPAFAHSAPYGDVIAAILALFSLLLLPSTAGVAAAWIFSLWGSADILNAFYQANQTGLLAGQLGAAFFLPTFIVALVPIYPGLG